jgi:antibiotic biosynthesis monooxygenase (ABM) superfamily enzyme
MNRSKKIFIIISVLFILLMIYFTVDIFSRTTAPWKKKKKNADTEQTSDPQPGDTIINQ